MAAKVIMPQMGESVAEGTIVRWIKKVGERVERDEPLLEISTDKVDAEIPSPAAGTLARILVKENETVEVNTVLAEIEGEGLAGTDGSAAAQPTQPATATPPVPAVPSVPPTPPEPERNIRSSPLVRRLAKEHQIDLTRVHGTGLGGRISKKDIEAYLASAAVERPGPEAAAPPPSGPSSVPVVPAAFTGPTQVVPMTPMRRQIAERMVASKRISAHVSTFFEVEMTRVAETLAQAGPEFEQRNGLRLTYTPFFVRASVEALKQFPIVNSSLDAENIVYKRDINIGVAVAIETGLIVPVVKHADEKSFLGVARAVRDLADRARSKRLSVSDVQEGTFTITNPGVFGSLIGTPIIHQPQVAILGVGAIEKRPVVRGDAIAIRPMVYLSLSFDHRVLDGALADQFMAKIKSILENWGEAVL
jgi:pyruvate dehydrogenase E2 component (dihydrolipoamide acetyltransferase)